MQNMIFTVSRAVPTLFQLARIKRNGAVNSTRVGHSAATWCSDDKIRRLFDLCNEFLFAITFSGHPHAAGDNIVDNCRADLKRVEHQPMCAVLRRTVSTTSSVGKCNVATSSSRLSARGRHRSCRSTRTGVSRDWRERRSEFRGLMYSTFLFQDLWASQDVPNDGVVHHPYPVVQMMMSSIEETKSSLSETTFQVTTIWTPSKHATHSSDNIDRNVQLSAMEHGPLKGFQPGHLHNPSVLEYRR